MAKILYVGTYATDDPTRASLPFMGAGGAKDAGHEPHIALLGEATYLLKGSIADGVQGVGFPPFKDLVATAVANTTPIYL